MSDNNTEEIKSYLVGNELTAVIFIQDYLQVHFNYDGFTFYIWPILNVNNLDYNITNSNYRNMLCKFINKTIADIIIKEEERFTIIFSNKDSISISLDPNNPDIIGEILIFHTNDEQIFIY